MLPIFLPPSLCCCLFYFIKQLKKCVVCLAYKCSQLIAHVLCILLPNAVKGYVGYQTEISLQRGNKLWSLLSGIFLHILTKDKDQRVFIGFNSHCQCATVVCIKPCKKMSTGRVIIQNHYKMSLW